MKMNFGKLGALGLSKSTLGAALAVSALVAGSTAALAVDAIPYPNKGVIAPMMTITATGSSVLFYFGANAQDIDYVNVYDTTTHTMTGFIFPNTTSSPGQSVTLPTSLNDVLVIEIIDTTAGEQGTYYSQATAPGGVYTCLGTSAQCLGVPTTAPASTDGVNHAYVTPFSGGIVNGVTVPPGTFIGLEDRDAAENSDFDYNDDQFILTGVTTSIPSSVPEPGSIALLGTGILGAAGLLRRRLLAS